MTKLILVVLLTLIVSTSFGILLNKWIKFSLNSFVTPIGFIALVAVLQILYYPAQLFNFSSVYIHIVSLAIYLVGIVFVFVNFKEIINEYWNTRTIIILVSFALFLFVFYRCYIDIEASDSQMYFGLMSQNINIDKLNLFSLWTGKYGQEWDTIYLFQGYYHFGSFLCWLTNIDYYLLGRASFVANITIETWGLGMLYSIISSMLIYNFVDYFKKKGLVRWLMLAFGLVYQNFYYWRVALSFYGNTFRTILTCALIFYLIRYFREDRKDMKYICILINFCGLACSSSYLFISFEVMYALMVYMFKKRGKGTISEMADFVLPIVIYTLASYSRDNIYVTIVGGVCALAYYIFRNKNGFVKVTDTIEEFLQKHAIKIFVIGVFALFAIGGAIYYLAINPDYYYGYWHWFDNHQTYDMIKDYFFVYSDWSNNIVNVLRWIGVIILLACKWEDKGFDYLKYMFIIVIILFLNPLVVIAVSYLIASNVYYRAFDIIFNPLTEMLFIYLISEKIKFKAVNPILVTTVAVVCIWGHVGSFVSRYTGEYGFYVDRDVMPKYKISYTTYNIIQQFSDLIKDKGYNNHNQAKIISHAEGLRTFEPETYVLFTPRQNADGRERLDETFFNQARYHYPWNDYGDIDYSSACSYIKKYNVDYAIVQMWDNPEYDEAIKACGLEVAHNEEYKIYSFGD